VEKGIRRERKETLALENNMHVAKGWRGKSLAHLQSCKKLHVEGKQSVGE